MRELIFCYYLRPVILIAGLCTLTLLSEAQTNAGGNNPQYLFPGFTKGLVIMKTRARSSEVLNYNMVTEKMVFEKDGKLLDLSNKSSVDTIILNNRKFIPFSEAFYEVLVNASISLFIQHKSDLVPAGSPAGYGSTSQTASIKTYTGISTSTGTLNLEVPADYNVNPVPVNWIRKDNTMFSFLNKRQFLKIFPDKNAEIEKFIKQNRIKIEERDDLIKLVTYCNELYK